MCVQLLLSHLRGVTNSGWQGPASGVLRVPHPTMVSPSVGATVPSPVLQALSQWPLHSMDKPASDNTGVSCVSSALFTSQRACGQSSEPRGRKNCKALAVPPGASYPSEPQFLHLENGYNHRLLPTDLQGALRDLWHHRNIRGRGGFKKHMPTPTLASSC